MAALTYKLIKHLDHDGTPVKVLRFRKFQLSDLALQHRVAAIAGETAGTIAVLAAMCGLPASVFETMGGADSERLGRLHGRLFD